MHEALHDELLAMAEYDSRIRTELAAKGELSDGYNARMAVGLEPLSKRTEEIRLRAAAEGSEAPDDFAAYIASRAAWARSVGWR